MTKTRDLADLANGITSANIVDGAVTNADINSSAAIAKTKISGTAITAADTGTVTSTMIADGTIVNTDINASAAVASSKLAFTQSGTGAVQRTAESKLRDVVSVLDFIPQSEHAAIKAGTTTYNAATDIQAAIDTGKSVFLPNGAYKLESPITLSTVGQRLFGESPQNTYLTGGLNHDLVRVAASHCEVDHIHFRPSGGSNVSPPAFAPLRIYAALAHIHDNRFLSSAPNTGVAIFLDDVNPVDSSAVAGAYIHAIVNNRIGASGYDFYVSIYSYNNNNGQQATKFQNNQIWGDSAFYVYKGGGNQYIGNLLQSATGTYSVGVGNGIDLQSGVVGETILGNYIERYDYGIIARRTTSDYSQATIYWNHWDNNNQNIRLVSSQLAAYFDEELWYDFKNTWQWRYGSQDDLKLVNREGIEVLNVNRASSSVEPRLLGHNLFQTISYTANAQTQTPVASWCEITGAGAHRTGCFLGNGTRTGQHLYLRAHTWSVELLNNPGGTQNIVFAGGASSATFGQSGNVGTMHLIWDPTYSGGGSWFEISRTLA
jgi:hypothetical protein